MSLLAAANQASEFWILFYFLLPFTLLFRDNNSVHTAAYLAIIAPERYRPCRKNLGIQTKGIAVIAEGKMVAGIDKIVHLGRFGIYSVVVRHVNGRIPVNIKCQKRTTGRAFVVVGRLDISFAVTVHRKFHKKFKMLK